jgi:hypothetical protein
MLCRYIQPQFPTITIFTYDFPLVKMSSPKTLLTGLTAVMLASVENEVFVQYDKKISADDKEGLYDTAQQVQHALDSQDINLRVDSFRWETSGRES